MLSGTITDNAMRMPDCAVPVPIDADMTTASSAMVLDTTVANQTPLSSHSNADWFLTPESWKIHEIPPNANMSFDFKDLKSFNQILQSWFDEWVSVGSNPFIHSQLYRHRFPGCVQIAYTTLSTYNNRTAANTDTILQIVEDRANELLRENGLVIDNLNQENVISDSKEPIDTLEQLARVHALMAYQMIGLFDGDIRSRHRAESRFPVLQRWVSLLLESADSNLRNPSPTFYLPYAGLAGVSCPLGSTESRWRTWIQAESVRRTWMIAKG
jgi:hypothetical protein